METEYLICQTFNEIIRYLYSHVFCLRFETPLEGLDVAFIVSAMNNFLLTSREFAKQMIKPLNKLSSFKDFVVLEYFYTEKVKPIQLHEFRLYLNLAIVSVKP